MIEVMLTELFVPLEFILILKNSRCANYISRWKRDVDFEIAEFTEEFSLVKVRHLVPAFIIVNRGLRIPLADDIGLPVMSHPGNISWELYKKRSGYFYFFSFRKRFR